MLDTILYMTKLEAQLLCQNKQMDMMVNNKNTKISESMYHERNYFINMILQEREEDKNFG